MIERSIFKPISILQISKNDVTNTENITKDQHKDDLWINARAGRITSSSLVRFVKKRNNGA